MPAWPLNTKSFYHGLITSGRVAATEYVLIFVDNYLYKQVNKIDSRVKDTPDMLNIIDMINDSNILTEDSVLVSFDIGNMFPSIDNVSGVEVVCEILENKETDFPSAECFLEAFERSRSFVWNGASFHLMKNFIYRKIALL